jgi:acetyltransferase-like isoleucine patch superfamily enzyme
MNHSSENPAISRQQAALTDESTSGLRMYKELSVGTEASWWHFFSYEIQTFFISGLAGVLGYALRVLLYPALFKRCGRRPAIGRGVILRRPKNISLGEKVLVDDYATLDVRGPNGKITLGSKVSIGRFSSIVSKDAEIDLSPGVNIGSYCRVATQSKVSIGESTLLAAYCYVGPGNHQHSDLNMPLISQDMEIKGGVKIGARCWLGTRVTVLDGVTIGDDVIIGAHSVVLSDIPSGAVAVGSPAKVIKMR